MPSLAWKGTNFASKSCCAEKLFAIDKLNYDEMKSMAASQSKRKMPEIKEHFMSHKVADYHPISGFRR